MNSQQVKELRGLLENKLYKIQQLKERLEKLEASRVETMEIIVSLKDLRIESNYINHKPLREFIKIELINQFKRQIIEMENELKSMNYNFN